MKKWIIATIILALLAIGVIFISGTSTGNAVYIYEQQAINHECSGVNDCIENNEVPIKESCDKLDCPKRGTELCKQGF